MDWDDDEDPLAIAGTGPSLEKPRPRPASPGGSGGSGAAGKAGAAGPAPPAASAYGGGGMTFDDDFDDAPLHADLELDLPSGPSGPQAAPSKAPQPSKPTPPPPPGSGRSTSGAAPPPAPSSVPSHPSHPSSLAGPPSSGQLPPDAPPSAPQVPQAPPKPSPAAIVAKYPPSPQKVWEAPFYFGKVAWRMFELRQDLESLRRKRSPDVPLYEAALKAHDKKAFALGLVMTLAAVTFATFILFLPVIFRFLRAPD
jgi:hypothetical protein